MTETTQGSCFCGAVQVQVAGPALLQGYCHCTSCRRWSVQPFIAYAMWPSDQVSIIAGQDSLAHIARNDDLTMHFCSACGGHIMAVSAKAGLTDVFPMQLQDFDFTPAIHVNYGERVVDLPDGLPKFRDMPARAGGSDEMIAE
ncbi:MAG: GFA family protein [Roseobacter sp.]|nr:GFA family protein [Roseobacter sp.]